MCLEYGFRLLAYENISQLLDLDPLDVTLERVLQLDASDRSIEPGQGVELVGFLLAFERREDHKPIAVGRDLLELVSGAGESVDRRREGCPLAQERADYLVEGDLARHCVRAETAGAVEAPEREAAEAMLRCGVGLCGHFGVGV